MKLANHALILPGGVAKGAYEAGVLEVLAEQGAPIHRVVAASSGALNAIVYVAGLRAGRLREATQELVAAWIEHGSWNESLHFSMKAWLSGVGLSDRLRLVKLLRELVKPAKSAAGAPPVELSLVVAPLNGVMGKVGDDPATTYESVLRFSGEDFGSETGLERVFQTAAAACAFPGLFMPVTLPGLGRCVDGGAVNNTPIRYALEVEGIDHIIVPIPYPRVIPPKAAARGIPLAEHMIEALINERLYRDLKVSEQRNRKLAALEASDALTPEQVRQIEAILSWRRVRICEVRPPRVLEGSLFSGFFSRELRRRYVEDGREAARKALAAQ